MVRPVPANETVVGVPGRTVLENKAEKAAHQAFAAYAVMAGEKDPYAEEISRLKAVVTEQTKLIQTMASQLGVKAEPAKLALTAKPATEKKAARKPAAKKPAEAKAEGAAEKKAAKPRRKAAKKPVPQTAPAKVA